VNEVFNLNYCSSEMLYYCGHVEVKHPISFHKFTPYFPKLILHDLFAGEGGEGRRWQPNSFSQAPFRLLKEGRGESSSLIKNINSVASAWINKFRNDHSR